MSTHNFKNYYTGGKTYGINGNAQSLIRRHRRNLLRLQRKVDIAKTSDGRHILYSTVGKTKRIGSAAVNSIANKRTVPGKNTYSANNISQSNSSVNNNSAKNNSSGNSDIRYAIDDS